MPLTTDLGARGVLWRFAKSDGAGLLALFVLACTCYRVWDRGNQIAAIDFYHYWLTPQAIRHGWHDDIYSPQGRDVIGRRSYSTIADPRTPDAERAAARAVFLIINQAEDTPQPLFATVEPNATPFCYACF